MQQTGIIELPKHPRTFSQRSIPKLAEISSATALKMGDAPVNDLLEIRASKYFETDLIIPTSNHAYACNDMVPRSEEKVMIDNGYHKCTLKNYVGALTRHAEWY